ncbi:MAG: PQQ-binding-like beta-propeller repeat protein [Bacteroidota bacterium]
MRFPQPLMLLKHMLLLFIFLNIAIGQVDHWPMHGHDAQRTNRSPVSGPTKATLKWSYDFTATRLQDNACPIVGPDSTVYQPTEDGFFAINPNGTLKWMADISNMRLAPALSSDGSVVYTVDAFNTVKALDTDDGSVQWDYLITGDVTYSSLVVDAGGTIYLGTRHPSAIYAINPDSTLKWSYVEPGSSSYGIEAPLSIGPSGFMFVMSNFSGLLSVDSVGNKRWSRGDMGAMASWPALTIDSNGTIYFPGEPSYNMYGAKAFNPDSTKKWQLDQTISPGPGYLAGTTISSDDSTVYVRNGHTVSAVASSTGAVQWSVSIPGTFDAFGGSPLLSGNGILYMVSDYDEIFAISAYDGLLLWQYELNTGPMYWGPQSAALGANGTLYVVSSGDYGYAGGTTPARLYAFYSNDLLTPVLHTPTDDSTYLPLTVTLRWYNAINALSYRLQVSTDSNFSTTVFDDSTLITTWQQIGPLDSGVTYYWHVRSQNSTDTAWSAVWGFTIVPEGYSYLGIDPNGDGGFENGETLANNGWTEVNGTQTSKWKAGTATYNGGSRAAYVSNNGGTSNQYYTIDPSTVHFYRDIVFPENDYNFLLTFDWKGEGENGYDFMKIYLVSTSTIPVAGTQLSSGQIGRSSYDSQNAYTTDTVIIDQSNAGTTKRLVFSWRNDNAFGTQPPAALDNISLTSEVPETVPVELVSFMAKLVPEGILLHWKTATEVNNHGFMVERKELDHQIIGSKDLFTDKIISQWTQISFIEGSGTNNAPKEYSFTDRDLSPGRYSYRLKQFDQDGRYKYSPSVEIVYTSVPLTSELSQNYPNPFNPSTVISYQIPVTSKVTLRIYDLLGREIATLVNEEQLPGWKKVQWNAKDVSSGVYFYKIITDSFVATKKLLLMK